MSEPRTIEVAVELAEQIRDWSELVRFRWGEDAETLEFRSASVGERLDWQKCETCGGEKEVLADHGYWNTKLCPDCVDGWTPPAELVLKAEEAYFEAEQGTADKWRNAMFYALLEQARWIGEQE